MSRVIIGVMGPGESASESACQLAEEMGKRIAQSRWTLLTGGRREGIMDSAAKGAREEGGLTVGILPSKEPSTISEHIDIPIVTDMGDARNNINVLSSDIVVAIAADNSCGTVSEIALALTHGKKVFLLGCGELCENFFRELGGAQLVCASSPEDVQRGIRSLLEKPV